MADPYAQLFAPGGPVASFPSAPMQGSTILPTTGSDPYAQLFSSSGPSSVTGPTISGMASQGISGVNEGMGRFFGAPVDLANQGLGAAFTGINKLAGTNLQTSQTPFLGSNWINQRQDNIGTVAPQSNNPTEQGFRYAGQQVGATVPAAILSGGIAPAAGILASGLTSAGGGTIGNKVGQWVANQTGGDPQQGAQVGQAIGETLGYGAPLGVTSAARAIGPRGPDLSAVPTVEQLQGQAGDLYNQGRAWGASATPEQTSTMAASMRKIAIDEGLIGPDGNVVKGYTPIKGALGLINQYDGQEMLPAEMQQVHKLLQDSAGSSDSGVSRVGTIMKKQFNQWVEPIVPEFSQADPIWARSERALALQQAIKQGDIKTSLLTGSGKENGLRTTFRNLQSGIIGQPGERGNPIGFQPDEIAAINTVADGTPGANFARNLGKLAPRGTVPMLGDAGVPFMIGNAIGGPPLGGVASATTMAAGEIGRRFATALIGNAANRALGVTLGSSTSIPSLPFRTQNIDSLMKALVTSQAANQSTKPERLSGALVGLPALP